MNLPPEATISCYFQMQFQLNLVISRYVPVIQIRGRPAELPQDEGVILEITGDPGDRSKSGSSQWI